MSIAIEDKEVVYKDSFDNIVDVGDIVLVSYRNQLLKAMISHVTKAGNLRIKFINKEGNFTGSVGSLTIGSYSREFIRVDNNHNNHHSRIFHL